MNQIIIKSQTILFKTKPLYLYLLACLSEWSPRDCMLINCIRKSFTEGRDSAEITHQKFQTIFNEEQISTLL